MNIVFLDRNTLAGDIRLSCDPLPAVQYREYPTTTPVPQS